MIAVGQTTGAAVLGMLADGPRGDVAVVSFACLGLLACVSIQRRSKEFAME